MISERDLQPYGESCSTSVLNCLALVVNKLKSVTNFRLATVEISDVVQQELQKTGTAFI